MRWKASSFSSSASIARALSPRKTAGHVRAFYRMNAGLTPYYIKIKRATTSRGNAGRRSHTLTPVVEVIARCREMLALLLAPARTTRSKSHAHASWKPTC